MSFIKITTEDIQRRREFNNTQIAAGMDRIFYDLDKDKLAVKCANCSNIVPVSPCSDCGGKMFDISYDSNAEFGLVCANCNQGFIKWTCKKSQTRNEVYKTIGKMGAGNKGNGGCLEVFIFLLSLVLTTTAFASITIHSFSSIFSE